MNLTARPGRTLWALGLMLCLGSAWAEEPVTSATPPEEPLVIKAAGEIEIGPRVWLDKDLKADAYQAEAIAAAKLLANDKLESKKKEALEEAVKREPQRAGAAFATCLDFAKFPDVPTRRGAIRGIQIANPSTKVVGKALANSAMGEPNKDVRKATIKLIKERRDTLALHTLLAKLAESSDPDGLGIVNEPQRDMALAALHDVGDRRAYDAILYYVTLEFRLGVANFVNVETKFITNSRDVNNGGGTLNLPIELPALELGKFEGVITVPAICHAQAALKRVTGEDFGKDLGKWREWVAAQPDVRK